MRLTSKLTCLLVAWIVAASPAWAETDGVQLPYTLDLSQPFHTRSAWQLTIVREPLAETHGETVAPEKEKVGAIRLCFQAEAQKICPPIGIVGQSGWYENDITRVAILPIKAGPLLLMTTGGAASELGMSFGVTTWVWAYQKTTDRFDLIFSNATGVTNNQETRLLEDGPLAGDIVVALNPPYGSRPPYPYTIIVYRHSGSSDYKQILHYAARSREGDRNPLAVIDAEMLEIEKRLHVWHDGQKLPIPKTMRDDCTMLELRHGVEWCR